MLSTPELSVSKRIQDAANSFAEKMEELAMWAGEVTPSDWKVPLGKVIQLGPGVIKAAANIVSSREKDNEEIKATLTGLKASKAEYDRKIAELNANQMNWDRRKSRSSFDIPPEDLDTTPISDPYLLTSLPPSFQLDDDLPKLVKSALSEAQLIKIPEHFGDHDNEFLMTIRTFDKNKDKPWRKWNSCGRCRTTNKGAPACQASVPCKVCGKKWCVWPLGDNLFAVFGPPIEVDPLPPALSTTIQPSSQAALT